MNDIHNIWNSLTTSDNETPRLMNLVMQSTPTTVSTTAAATYATLIGDIKNLLTSIANDIEAESHIFDEENRFAIENVIHELEGRLLYIKNSVYVSVKRQKDHNE